VLEWSSYRINAQGERSKLLKSHVIYQTLGLTEAERQERYRELFRYELELGLVDEIHRATNGNFVLGNDRFKEAICKTLARRVTPGRPIKSEY